MMNKKLLTTLVLAPLLAVTLAGCSQSIELPEADTGPTGSYVPGTVPGDNVNPDGSTKDPENGEDPASDDPFATLPTIATDDPQFEEKTSMIEDIKDVREALILVGDNNPVAEDMKLDAEVVGETTVVNTDKDTNEWAIYEIVITEPDTRVKVEGTIAKYTVTVTNDGVPGFKLVYDSESGTFKS
jgi:hypothetical protein